MNSSGLSEGVLSGGRKTEPRERIKNASGLSLKQKMVIIIVLIVASISVIAGFFCAKWINDTVKELYIDRSVELAETAAVIVDPKRVQNVKNAVLEIYENTEDKVSTEEWGTQEFYNYIGRYAEIENTEDFTVLQGQLRAVQDSNSLESVYIVCFDVENENTIYLVDASPYDGNCPPGAFDDVMYEVDHRAMENPHEGVAPDITNTAEYGWIVAAGRPVFDAQGELIAFTAVDISMNDVIDQQNRFLIVVVAALLVLAVLFILICIFLVDRYVIKPINILSDTSEKYWSEDSSAIHNDFSQIQIHTGDEIEMLSNSMKQMEQNINDHITQILETTKELISTKERADEMDRIANIDALTKVRNKRSYDIEIERIEKELKEGNTEFGLVMIDLNFLKKINDSYGHEKGDQSIQLLCKLICGIFRFSPVFRIGGDEFIVILENNDYQNIGQLSSELDKELARIQEKTELEPWERISAAAGYALFDPSLDENMGSVFKRADRKMYDCKKKMKAVRE